MIIVMIISTWKMNNDIILIDDINWLNYVIHWYKWWYIPLYYYKSSYFLYFGASMVIICTIYQTSFYIRIHNNIYQSSMIEMMLTICKWMYKLFKSFIHCECIIYRESGVVIFKCWSIDPFKTKINHFHNHYCIKVYKSIVINCTQFSDCYNIIINNLTTKINIIH